MSERLTAEQLRDLLRYCRYFRPQTDFQADLRHYAERAAHELLALDPPHEPTPNDADIPF